MADTIEELEFDDFEMDGEYETQEDILKRQVALSIPIGRKIGDEQLTQKITIVEPITNIKPTP